jgi:hypothetical protein
MLTNLCRISREKRIELVISSFCMAGRTIGNFSECIFRREIAPESVFEAENVVSRSRKVRCIWLENNFDPCGTIHAKMMGQNIGYKLSAPDAEFASDCRLLLQNALLLLLCRHPPVSANAAAGFGRRVDALAAAVGRRSQVCRINYTFVGSNLNLINVEI